MALPLLPKLSLKKTNNSSKQLLTFFTEDLGFGNAQSTRSTPPNLVKGIQLNTPLSQQKPIVIPKTPAKNEVLKLITPKTFSVGVKENGISLPYKLDLSKYNTGKQIENTVGVTGIKVSSLGLPKKMYNADWWKRSLETIVNAPAQAVGGLQKSLVDLSEAILPTGKYNEQKKGYYAPKVTPAGRATAMANTALAGAQFIPSWAVFNTALETAKTVPRLSTVANAVSKGFEYLGKGGAKGAGVLLDILPINDKTKEELRPITETIGGFVAQYLLARAVHKGIGEVAKIKLPGERVDLTWKDVKDITLGKEVAPAKINLYKKLSGQGVKLGEKLKSGTISIKNEGQSVGDFVMGYARGVVGKMKESGFGLSVEDITRKRNEAKEMGLPELPQVKRSTSQTPTFQGLEGLSTKIVEKLKGKSTVSKQFISDLTNNSDIKQVERDMIRNALEMEGDKVNVADLAKKVQGNLSPPNSPSGKMRLKVDPESMFPDMNMEIGYQEWRRFINRSKDSLELDHAGFVAKVKKKLSVNQIENKFFPAVSGGGEYGKSNDEVLDLYRARYDRDKKAIVRAKPLPKFPDYLREKPVPALQKTNTGYVFNGLKNTSSAKSTSSQPPPKQSVTQPIASMVVPKESQELSLTQQSQEARQRSQAQGKTNQAVPLEESIVRPGITVKEKVNILDFLRTPQNVLKKIGLEKEAVLLKQKYDDYLRELPIEINKVTAWSKRTPNEGASERIFKHLDGQGIPLQGEELTVANEIKTYLQTWAKKLQLPEDRMITHYITHLFDPDLIAQEFDPDLARLITDKVAGSVYDPFLQKRLGARGYKEDVWQALDAYIKRAVRKVNMDVALNPLEAAANRLDVDSYKYVERLVARINLRPTDLDNLFDNLLKSSPIGYKLGQRPIAVISRKIRQATYRGTLGLNIGSALRNLTQGVNTYAELGEKYTLKGYIELMKSVKNGSTELADTGVLRDDFIQDRSYNATKKFWEKTDKGLFVFFEVAEKINRGSAYFGAKAKALASGKTEKEAIEYAVRLVEKTQFRFGSVDTPVALQGDLVKLFAQFQSFNIKQTEFLIGKITAREWVGLFRFLLASAFITATVGNLIGLKWQDNIPFSGVLSGKTKLGETPFVKSILTIMGAVLDSPGAFGRPRDLNQKVLDLGSSLIPFIPAGSQMKKIYQALDANKTGKLGDGLSLFRGAIFGKYNVPKQATAKKSPGLPKLKLKKIGLPSAR